MTADHISFSDTSYFNKLILDYVAGKPGLQKFYKYPPTPEAIEAVIRDKTELIPTEEDGINRKVLVETILHQYEGIGLTEAVQENIQSLSNSITFCIVTAHQLNVCTGPLYYIYKIAQAIATCRQLSALYPNTNFVPVYWMGSEDHDFEEINHISLFGKKLEWTDKQGGATGMYSTASLQPMLEEVRLLLGESVHAGELSAILGEAYALPTLSAATRYLVNALFGKYGLVVVDGDDKVFKEQFAEIMKEELLQRNAVRLVLEQLEKLEAKGYKAQAIPREINLFYLRKNSRERIEYDAGTHRYRVLNSSIELTKEELEKELQEHPERFSPNVILRPLFQQKVLPALAYIGGGGEISYWLQLKPVFEYYGINFPQLLVRNSALLIPEQLMKKIEKSGLEIKDFFLDKDQLARAYLAMHVEEDVDVSVYKETISGAFSGLQELAKRIDPTLVNAIGAEMQKSLQSVDSIQKRLVKALKQKNETGLNQVEKVRLQLFPENGLQERTENFASFYALKGRAFLDELIADFDVYHHQFLIIQP